VQIIALIDAAVLLYLKKEGQGIVPELAELLKSRGLETSANYLAMALRNLENRGWVELVGSRRRRGDRGPASNLWALTPAGHEEALSVQELFVTLLEPVDRLK
jgi:DNA-binding PadR family transcriptional regulator